MGTKATKNEVSRLAEKGLTPKQIGEILGVTARYISKIARDSSIEISSRYDRTRSGIVHPIITDQSLFVFLSECASCNMTMMQTAKKRGVSRSYISHAARKLGVVFQDARSGNWKNFLPLATDDFMEQNK